MSEEDSVPRKRNTPVPYKVGKYHPPKHTQFKPGQSGNPKGRKKKPVHVGAIVDALFDRKISVLIEGKPVKISGIEALLRSTFKDAVKGHHASRKLLFDFAKLRRDATEEAPQPGVDVDRMNSNIDRILERLQDERDEKLRAEVEAKQKREILE